MGKVVYNACYGGFGLSEKATERYAELKELLIYKDPVKGLSIPHYYLCPVEDYHKLDAEAQNRAYYYPKYDRDDPILVQVVEELGKEANGMCARLEIEDVPAGSLWRIDEYDGNESVMVRSDYDWKIAK